jgi:hypothetical protein
VGSSNYRGKQSEAQAVVLDSSWEQTAAFYLQQQEGAVYSYAKNEPSFLLTPYEYEGVQQSFEPDYLVRLMNGKPLFWK